MRFNRILPIIVMVLMVFLCMPNTVFAEETPIDSVYILATTNNELPTGTDDPDLLNTKPAIGSEFYLWVLSSAANELVGADVSVSFNPSLLSAADMDAIADGVQPVMLPAAPDANEASIFELAILNAVEAGESNEIIKYAASNTAPSSYAQSAVLLKTKFVVTADIANGLYFDITGLELRGGLGIDNNPIIITPAEVKPLHLAFDATAKVEALETAVTADLTVPVNMTAADSALSTAGTAVAEVPIGATKTELENRVTAAKAVIVKSKSAITAVEELEAAVAEDLTILANMKAADLKVTEANTAVGNLTAGSATRIALETRITAAQAIINNSKAAIAEVEALEAAVTADLSVSDNMTAAEAKADEANTAVMALEINCATRLALEDREAAAQAIIDNAKLAITAVQDLEAAVALDLSVPENLAAAEARQSEANIAIGYLVPDSATRIALQARYDAASATIDAAKANTASTGELVTQATILTTTSLHYYLLHSLKLTQILL